MAAPAPPLFGSHGPKRALAPPPISAAWRRRAGILAAVLATLIALYAAVGFFVVPRIVVSKIQALATAELGRRATVGKAQFNPFTLQARLADFALADRDPARTLLRFDT